MSIKTKKFGRVLTGLGLTALLIGGSLAVLQVSSQDKSVAVNKKSEASVEPTKVKTNPNAESSIESFLTKWSEAKGESVQALITDNFNSVTGNYAYAVSIVDKDKSFTLDLGLSTVVVPEQKIVGHKGFLDSVVDLKVGANGLAIVSYQENNIIGVEIYQLDYTIAEIQEALLNADLSKGKTTNKPDIVKDEKTYDVLTAEEWKGMALLTSREIIANNMAPIFIVPTSSISASKDLTDTFYYIIAGTLESTSGTGTSLRTYQDKKISLDFGVTAKEEDIGKPAWIHVVTKNGKIENIELQTFKDASITTMAEGLTSYINVASATYANE